MFPNAITPKVNVIARLEFELIYFEATVQHFRHYTSNTSKGNIWNLGTVWKLFVLHRNTLYRITICNKKKLYRNKNTTLNIKVQ